MFSRHQRGGSQRKTKRLFWARRSLHSVYLVPVSCSYTGATSIVFVKWLGLIRIQMTAKSKLQGSFFLLSCFLFNAAEESKRLYNVDVAFKYPLNFLRGLNRLERSRPCYSASLSGLVSATESRDPFTFCSFCPCSRPSAGSNGVNWGRRPGNQILLSLGGYVTGNECREEEERG